MRCNFGSSWHLCLPSLKFNWQVSSWRSQVPLAKQRLNRFQAEPLHEHKHQLWPRSVTMGSGSKQPWEPPALCSYRNACVNRKRCPVANTWLTAGHAGSLWIRHSSCNGWDAYGLWTQLLSPMGHLLGNGNFKISLAVTKCLLLHKLSK